MIRRSRSIAVAVLATVGLGTTAGASSTPDSGAESEPGVEAGAPAPQPLAEMTPYVVSTGFTAEFIAPLLLAEHFGEFEKENLDVEIVSMSFPDAIPQIASGQVDVAVGATDAALMNAASEGLGIRWGMGNFFPANAGDLDVAQTGLWVRRDVFSTPDDPDLAELSGARMASAIGIGNSTSYFIESALAPHGVSITDLTWEQIASADMVTALDNGAVDMAWLLDPYWLDVAERPDDYVLAATQIYGEAIGGYYFGPEAFAQDRDAAEAFTRAIVRTITTYLAGDYHADAEVMAVLAETIGQPAEAMERVPSLLFTWEIADGVGDRIQDTLRIAEVLGFDETLPESEFVDRSLYEAVLADEV